MVSGTLPRLLRAIHPRHGAVSLAEHLNAHGPIPHARPGWGRTMLGEIEASGLLGRGGAGFPTGRKWRTVAAQRRRPMVVANGAETEPASSKDKFLLTAAPHLVLDGAITAARVIGADVVYLYVPRSVELVLREAVREREEAGLDTVQLTVVTAPRLYLAGEESAVVHHLNGGQAAKPVFVGRHRPYQKGVEGRPTLINNVETLAHVGLISRLGSSWFRQLGPPTSPGSTLVTVTGAVKRPGVAEIALGSSLRSLVEAAGGPTEPIQAFLLGGYFGTWLPGDQALDLALEHQALAAVGASLGAGVIVALPESACGLGETARVAAYMDSQKARQCGPCVNGLAAIAEQAARLAWGRPHADVRSVVEFLAGRTAGRGACRHPDGAVRLVTSALRTFSSEVDSHIAGSCTKRSAANVLPVPQVAG